MSLFYTRISSMQVTTIEVHTATYYALNGRKVIEVLDCDLRFKKN